MTSCPLHSRRPGRAPRTGKQSTNTTASFVLHNPKVNFDGVFSHYEASIMCANVQERFMLKSAHWRHV